MAISRPTSVTAAGLALAVLLGLFFGASAFTFYSAEGASYLSNDPKACVNCHIMREQFDGWQKASHHAVATCNDCHVPHDLVGKYLCKLENGYFHSKGFTLQNFHEPIQIRHRSSMVLDNNCLHCHEALVQEIRGHGRNEDQSLQCVHCHGSVGHGPNR